MVDIWKYYAYHRRITITDNDEIKYSGYVADVVDKNENDYAENFIAIYKDGGGIVCFDESEIASIVDAE